MNIESYEKFCGRYELYNLLDEAIEAEKSNNFTDYDDFIANFKKDMSVEKQTN